MAKYFTFFLDTFFECDNIALMAKIFILIICFAFSSSILTAETVEDRRIEEEKRDSLRPTEAGSSAEKRDYPKPIAPIDLVYFAELITKRITYRYDACKILVLLVGAEDRYIDLGSQVTFLKEKGLLPQKYEAEFDPMKPLRKGITAYMFCKALEIRGGLLLRFFGMSERYCVKELAYEGIMASGNVNEIVSGEELVSVFTQSITYITKKKVAAGPKD